MSGLTDESDNDQPPLAFRTRNGKSCHFFSMSHPRRQLELRTRQAQPGPVVSGVGGAGHLPITRSIEGKVEEGYPGFCRRRRRKLREPKSLENQKAGHELLVVDTPAEGSQAQRGSWPVVFRQSARVNLPTGVQIRCAGRACQSIGTSDYCLRNRRRRIAVVEVVRRFAWDWWQFMLSLAACTFHGWLLSSINERSKSVGKKPGTTCREAVVIVAIVLSSDHTPTA